MVPTSIDDPAGGRIAFQLLSERKRIMATYFSIIVINPEDWEDFLDSQDSLPTVLTYDPTNTQTPTFRGGANATLQEFYFCSDTGYPADGPASMTILVDQVGDHGVEHRQTLLYVGSVVDGEAFCFDEQKYPIRTNIY
jgi:hypothetical protein